MTPCLVLNDEDKKIRFKKSQEKKIQETNIFINNEVAASSNAYRNTLRDITEEHVEVKYEAESDDEHEEAHNYTLAFLNAQQYKYEYENNITHESSDESSDQGVATTSIKTECSHAGNVLETNENFEKSFDSCSEPNNHQRLRQLLELSHKAAICAKLKDTDFPKIFQSKLFDCDLDYSMLPKVKVTTTEEPEVQPVSFKKVYLHRNSELERGGLEEYSEDETDYSHTNFKTSQEQQDLIIRMLENRKRKSVIVSGPHCKSPFPLSFADKYYS